MSDTFFELRVEVREIPAREYVARCEGYSASCTYCPKVAAKRAAAKAVNKSGKVSVIVGAEDICLHQLPGRERFIYRATFAPRVRRCRVCGCTDDDCRQCIAKTGAPCHWVEKDLCSACVESRKAAKPQRLQGARFTTAGKKVRAGK